MFSYNVYSQNQINDEIRKMELESSLSLVDKNSDYSLILQRGEVRNLEILLAERRACFEAQLEEKNVSSQNEKIKQLKLSHEKFTLEAQVQIYQDQLERSNDQLLSELQNFKREQKTANDIEQENIELFRENDRLRAQMNREQRNYLKAKCRIDDIGVQLKEARIVAASIANETKENIKLDNVVGNSMNVYIELTACKLNDRLNEEKKKTFSLIEENMKCLEEVETLSKDELAKHKGTTIKQQIIKLFRENDKLQAKIAKEQHTQLTSKNQLDKLETVLLSASLVAENIAAETRENMKLEKDVNTTMQQYLDLTSSKFENCFKEQNANNLEDNGVSLKESMKETIEIKAPLY